MNELETHWRQLSALMNELDLPQLLAAHVPPHQRRLAQRLAFLVWQIDCLWDERGEQESQP
jgi:hypothetical protein